MSNPALTRLSERALPAPTPPAPSVAELNKMWDRPSPQPPVGPPGTQPPDRSRGYGGGGGDGQPTRYMTLDDVVVRAGAMLAVLFAAAALTWALAPTWAHASALVSLGMVGGLALGLYIAFTMRANAVTSLIYATFEGVFVGGVSRVLNDRYPGVVIQAVTGTVAVAAGMLLLYRSGAIRVTPRFTRVVLGATLGVVGLMVADLAIGLFVHGGLGLRDAQHHAGLAIAFSLLCIGLAAFNLVLDFDLIEHSIKRGVDEKFAWYAAFGLMVTIIWLYLEILRLLVNVRD